MSMTRIANRMICVTMIFSTASLCVADVTDGVSVSEADLLAIIAKDGQFTQLDGSYTIKSKKVDGRVLKEVEIQYLQNDGVKATLRANKVWLRVKSKDRELEVTFDEGRLESGKLTAVLRDQLFALSEPMRKNEKKK
jgi:hypothetical protein